MNDYCSNVADEATAEDIPDIIRLYSDKAASAQNEFITNALDEIVLKDPKSGIKKIIDNIQLLEQEDALDCISEFFLIFINWNEDITDVFLEELLVANNEKGRYFIERLKFEAYEKNDDCYAEFLTKYYGEIEQRNLDGF